MSDNEERRLARRQKRGLRRTEEILHAAGEIFVAQGYDRATTQMIAQRADVSAGSLYQFFPNKEMIAQALAAQCVAHLVELYDTLILAPEVMALPFPGFLDRFIDVLITFNQQNPGYFALLQGSTTSPQLALVLQELRQEVAARMVRVIQILAPVGTPEQWDRLALVAYRIFLALLPLILQAEDTQKDQWIQELKTLLFRYFEPMQVWR